MIRLPPGSSRTYTLFPDTTRFRSVGAAYFGLSAYQSRFKGEVLIQVDQNFARVDARNAERTVVDGIEAATSFRLANNLSGRLAYAYESSRFRSDPVYGNNRLEIGRAHV